MFLPFVAMLKLPPVILSLRDETEMVLVPGGEFWFGTSEREVERILGVLNQPKDPVFKTELPRRSVRLKDCYIDRCPVTNARYEMFLKATGHPAPLFREDPRWNHPDKPVTGISWHDARAYCRWAEKRLPTEEEWERAARGTDERVWPWGSEFHRQNCNSLEWGEKRTTEVGRFRGGVSPVGAFDMAGNVWELTDGNWEGFGKAIRGGSYQNPAAFCRTTCRWGIDPAVTGSTWLGFRCVMDVAKARIYARAKPQS